MSVAIFTSLAAQFDASGNPLSGGSVTLYQAGTTTLINNYTASDLSGSPASNPITLDSAGKHAMRYFALQAYKVLLKNSSGATITTFDNIDPGVAVGTGVLAIANGGTGAATGPAALTAIGGATAASVADVATQVAALAGAAASSEKTHIATGTTGQRPSSPIDGDIRKNTTTARYEVVNAALTYENVVTTTTLKADSQALAGPLTVQYLTSGSSATYTLPTDCTAIRVKAIGGGGGGGGATANNGVAGGDTSFNSVVAKGGGGGSGNSRSGGTGGNSGTGSASLRISGTFGGASGTDRGGDGAASPFGGGGGAGVAGAGGVGATNSGGGGGGGNSGASSGGGGAAGEYIEIVITSPSATYTYTVGAAGAGGAAGGSAGGNGGSGLIIVEELYH